MLGFGPVFPTGQTNRVLLDRESISQSVVLGVLSPQESAIRTGLSQHRRRLQQVALKQYEIGESFHGRVVSKAAPILARNIGFGRTVANRPLHSLRVGRRRADGRRGAACGRTYLGEKRLALRRAWAIPALSPLATTRA